MYLLARQEVSEDPCRGIKKFASFAKDRDDLVEVLKDSWELDQARSLDARVQVAGILCAFQNAKLSGRRRWIRSSTRRRASSRSSPASGMR